ncbi:hypothetical protein OEZ71_06005 [Defluviimonas sp. WL0050]|uniref:Uncharacterized protein n=1 Tax=Albidovulum litorale TaxID=2984134 RepID=A0ABT2ZL34_9RHOB|nr:hypothetical protein [Defluviimonas sp. WL0050]MCV2871845.1 hypothetical protein [Defluviimonas sp. WL0050]
MSPEAWSALANWMMAISAAAGAIAAYVGLNAWKNQSIWQADHELARKTLVALYRYRDSLYSVRHPAMRNDEMRLEEEDAQHLNEDQKRKQGVIVAYARRWERHSNAKNALDALLIEADAVWGEDLSNLVKPLRDLEHELFVYIMLHLDAHFRNNADLQNSYREILKKKRDILYDLLSEDDEFRKDFSHHLSAVEDYLRDKLGRST